MVGRRCSLQESAFDVLDDYLGATLRVLRVQVVVGRAKPLHSAAPEGFERRDVKTGKADDTSVEIVSGLSSGDQIAVQNTFLLKAELGKGEAEHHD